MSDISNAVAVVEEEVAAGGSSSGDILGAIQGLNNPSAAFYSSLKGADHATKIAIATAMTNSLPIDEHLDKTLTLENIIVQKVELADEQTGELNDAPRVILITTDGTAYHATSVGLLRAVANLIAVVGEPDQWGEPVKVKVVEQKGRRGFKFFTFQFVK